MESITPRLAGPPVHPGEILRDIVLPALKEGKAEVARHLGVNRSTLYDILAGKQAVTADMALRLGKLFGNGPEIWLNLQARYDLAMAREKIGAGLEAIPTLEAVG